MGEKGREEDLFGSRGKGKVKCIVVGLHVRVTFCRFINPFMQVMRTAHFVADFNQSLQYKYFYGALKNVSVRTIHNNSIQLTTGIINKYVARVIIVLFKNPATAERDRGL